MTAWKPSQGALIGGELAADRAGLGVRPATGSVYVSAWNASAVVSLRAPPDPEGPVVVRERFCEGLADPADSRLTHPLIVLAELSMLPDPRLDEACASLRQRLAEP